MHISYYKLCNISILHSKERALYTVHDKWNGYRHLFAAKPGRCRLSRRDDRAVHGFSQARAKEGADSTADEPS